MGIEETLPLDKTRICANDICMQKDVDHDTLVQKLAKETEEFHRDYLETTNPEKVFKFLKRIQTLLRFQKSEVNDDQKTEGNMDLRVPATENQCCLIDSSFSSTPPASCLETKHHVARNHVIVHRTMEHLNSRNVLVLRLVSKVWLEVGTKILQNTAARVQDLQVSFTWSSYKNDYENFRMGTLHDFTTLLNTYPSSKTPSNTTPCFSTTITFPTKQFRFDGGGNLNSPHCRLFFEKHGPSFVHGLVLNLKPKEGAEDKEKTGIDVLRHLLLYGLPSLQRLVLINTPWNTEGTENPEDILRLFPNPGKFRKQMPALKILELKTSAQIPRNLVLDILTAAPNLKTTRNIELKFLDQIMTAEKAKTVTLLAWAFDVEEVERLTTFAQTKPAIQHLGLALNIRNVPDQWPACANIINQLLVSSADSLEIWNLLPSMDYLQHLVIPVMTKLHTAYISEEIKHANYKIFPPNLSPDFISSRFPSVRSVFFSDPNKRFGTESTVGLSKKAAGWVQIIHEAFPRLHHLSFEIVTMSEIPDFCRAVWKLFPELKTLRINISYETTTIDKYLCSDMDSAITGIPVQVCRNLRRALRQKGLKKGLLLENENPLISIPVSRDSAELFRQQPSICDLKDLAAFEVYWKKCDGTFYQPPLFSEVSQLYGFDLMCRADFIITSWSAFYAGRVVEKMDRSLHLSIH